MSKARKESVARALAHHEATGAITFLSPPGQGQPKYRVRLYGQTDVLDLTVREAYVLALGLAVPARGEEHRP